jgi:hypothetical protein
MNRQLKYIIVNDMEPYLFPEHIDHHAFAYALGRRENVTSAGKVSVGHFIDGTVICAIPGSVTLRIKWSKEGQDRDTELIRRAMGGPEARVEDNSVG